jgi:hypothetical protein
LGKKELGSNPEMDLIELKKYGTSLKYSDRELEDGSVLKTVQSLKKFFTITPEGLDQRQFVTAFGDSIRSTIVPMYVYNLSSGSELQSKYKGYDQVILKDMYALIADLVDKNKITEKDLSVENKQTIEATVAGKWFFNKLMKNKELEIPSNMSKIISKNPDLEKKLLEIQDKSKNIDKNDKSEMNKMYLEVGALLYTSISPRYKSYSELPKNYSW